MSLELLVKEVLEKETRALEQSERENLQKVSTQFDGLVAEGLIIPDQYAIEPTNPSSRLFNRSIKSHG